MSLDNVKHIVLVLSGKGGVGKSSITTQLALSLSLAGHSVGILDIDLTGPSIPRLLGLEDAKITQAPGGWLPVEVHPSQILPPISHPATPNSTSQSQNGESNGPFQPEFTNGAATPLIRTKPAADAPVTKPIGSLHAISLALLLPSRSSAVVWRGPKKTAMVRQFLTSVLWPPTTYLLIDTPPGTSDEHISLAETLLTKALPGQLSGAVIVTTPQAVAISDVRKEVNFCRKTGIKVLGVVENMSGFVCECCGERSNLFGKGGGEVMAREFGVRFLGGVPVDSRWGGLVEEGKRPVYGDVMNNGEDENDGEGEDAEEDTNDVRDGERVSRVEQDEEGREEGLLVDKYRNCALCGVFEGITRQLVDTMDGQGNGTG
ncbi:hypothetical protein N7G274_006661 [Stereocaulon virgatum]|uniref:Cytosolic Fe-S cluster assembly factor CFD1 n=1 Tax=Stereocaulon virgatum TaxID=373712 RepID=A0ABR4A8H4_9LECA